MTGSLCGQPIYFDPDPNHHLKKRRCTLGGVITIGEKPYVLTVAHTFSSNFKPPNLSHNAGEGEIEEFELFEDSEDDDLEDDLTSTASNGMWYLHYDSRNYMNPYRLITRKSLLRPWFLRRPRQFLSSFDITPHSI